MPPYTNQYNTPLLQKVVRHKIPIGLLVCVLLVIWLISQYAFVQITINEAGDKEVAFELVGGDGTNSGKTTNETIKKLVRKGDYQVTLTSGDQSFFSIATASGFLQTTTINASLKNELARSFIGNTPSTCLHSQSGDTLISWQCGGTLKNSKYHLAPSGISPSHNQPLSRYSEDIEIGGIVYKDGQQYVFGRLVDEYETTYGLYPVGSNSKTIDLAGFQIAQGLSQGKEYTVTPYKEGYLVFDSSGSEYLYFANFAASPEKINITQTQLKDISFYGLSTSRDSIVVLNNKHFNQEYPSQGVINPSTAVVSDKYSEESDEGLSTESSPVDYSEVVVLTSGKELRHKLDYAASQARLCGEDKLCVIGNETLYIYKIDGSRLKKLKSITGIKQMHTTNETTNLVTKQGIIRLDTEHFSGNYVYSFGNFTFCGISSTGDGKLLVCVSDNGKSNVLVIDNTNNDDIDKKISNLQKLPEVQSVSIYKNGIVIGPRIDKMVFNRALSSYTYDPQEVIKKKAIIQEKLNSENIDTSKYNIRFTTN